MRVRDLADDPHVELDLVVGADGPAMDAPVQWCAVTELMDPTPHLSAGAALLTTGMGLRFSDVRTWSAYVERLVRARVSVVVFGLGTIHRHVPQGLIRACTEWQMPLLALPVDTPLLEVSRRVTDRLAQERLRELSEGWRLAEDCTRALAAGEGLGGVLARIGAVFGGTAEIVDAAGVVLARPDENDNPDPTQTTAGQRRVRDASAPGRTSLLLPTHHDHGHFRLSVTGVRADVLVQSRLGPVAAVIGMELGATLTSLHPMHTDEAARFVEGLLTTSGEGIDDLTSLAVEAGFTVPSSWCVVRLDPAVDMPRPAMRALMWRARTALDSRIGRARVVERNAGALLLVQAPTGQARREASERGLDAWVMAVLDEVLSPLGEVSAGVVGAETIEELLVAARVAERSRHASMPRPGVRRLPPLTLDAAVTGLPAPGVVALADRLLAPVAAGGPELMATLDAWLRHCGRGPDVCRELFIHRNTLTARMATIRGLMTVDLDDGDARAACILALRVRGR
ncbi:MAG: PucR family transcriptional regulator [Micrococcus sp.]|nr:PucR family transcriptional regulator [Micrococcus sp.]